MPFSSVAIVALDGPFQSTHQVGLHFGLGTFAHRNCGSAAGDISVAHQIGMRCFRAAGRDLRAVGIRATSDKHRSDRTRQHQFRNCFHDSLLIEMFSCGDSSDRANIRLPETARSVGRIIAQGAKRLLEGVADFLYVIAGCPTWLNILAVCLYVLAVAGVHSKGADGIPTVSPYY
jgi:hypothetical protein